MSFCSPPKIFKPLYKFCNILIPGRAEQNNLQAGPTISARLTPLVENEYVLMYHSIGIDDGNETNDVIDYFASLKPRKNFLSLKITKFTDKTTDIRYY